jgi:hypothetical protein
MPDIPIKFQNWTSGEKILRPEQDEIYEKLQTLTKKEHRESFWSPILLGDMA